MLAVVNVSLGTPSDRDPDDGGHVDRVSATPAIGWRARGHGWPFLDRQPGVGGWGKRLRARGRAASSGEHRSR